jgi:hypothetical protein
MFKRIPALAACVCLLASAAVALAGGAPTHQTAPTQAAPYCGPAYGPGGPKSAYWGDAPMPGICGGVVALPFLVVGSLLGGNTAAPAVAPPYQPYNYAPAPGPRYAYPAQPAPAPVRYAAPGPYTPPAPYPPAAACMPPAPCPPPAACPPPAYGACGPQANEGGGLFAGLPCLELCAGLLGSFGGGGTSFLPY